MREALRAPTPVPARTVGEALAIEPGEVAVFTGGGDLTAVLRSLSAGLTLRGRVLVTTTTQMPPAADENDLPPVLAERYDDLLAGLEMMLSSQRRTVATRGVLAGGMLRGIPRGWIDRLRDANVADYILVLGDDARGRPLKVAGADDPVIPGCARVVIPCASVSVVDRPLDDTVACRPEVLAARLDLQFRQRLTPRHVAQALLGPDGCAKDAPAGCRVLPLLLDTTAAGPVATKTTAYELRKLGAQRIIACDDSTGRLHVEVYA